MLIQGKWKYRPDPETEEETKLQALEQKLLTLMLKIELELADSIESVKNNTIPGQNPIDIGGRNSGG